MVRKNLGQTRLLFRRKWQRILPDRGLLRPPELFRGRRNPPATLVEMTLGTTNNPKHYYDVSLVDGFNIPVSMIPIRGTTGCGVAACEADLNQSCPEYLAVKCQGKIVGCKSACLATNSPKYCCTGEFANKNTCKPTAFSRLFKSICPRAYSYAFDESTGLKSCEASRYLITFCPPT